MSKANRCRPLKREQLLDVQGVDSGSIPVDFTIDTGFTEAITLPQAIIDSLNLIRSSDIVATLADGTTRVLARYATWIQWHDQPREIVAISLESELLIGMKLMQGSNLNVDAIPSGQVTITKLLN